MSDEDVFLAALQADPADDMTRLVYADWLDERSDPRGEYIRLQNAIALVAPHTDHYAALRTRLKELRKDIPDSWVEVMGYRPRHRPLFGVLPERRADRWRLIEEFIEVWHRPLAPEDGYTEEELRVAEQRLGFGFPAALREWYALAGRRHEVWSMQDRFCPLNILQLDSTGNTLIFRVATDLSKYWGIRVDDLSQDDPPIWEIVAGVQVSPTTSAFASLVVLYVGLHAEEMLLASGEEIGHENDQALVVRGLSRCDLPDRYLDSPIHLYEGTDLIVGCCVGKWVRVACRGEEAYRQLDEEVRLWYLEVDN